MTETGQELRFDAPLYSLAEAVRYLDVPYSTFAGRRRAPSVVVHLAIAHRTGRGSRPEHLDSTSVA